MNQHNQEKRENYIKKLVSNSRAIISNQIAIPLGCHKMTTILSWISNIEPMNEIDVKIFSQYDSEIKHLPIGTERLAFNVELLLSEDATLDRITASYKNKIIEKCFEIIRQFQVDTK